MWFDLYEQLMAVSIGVVVWMVACVILQLVISYLRRDGCVVSSFRICTGQFLG